MSAGRPGTDDVAELLARLRASSGLSIDAEGRFHHEGTRITHARTLEVLWRSLTRTGDGRYQVAIGRERADVRIEDTPYGVRAVRLSGEAPVLCLTDGSEEPLDPATLALGADGVLRCRVKGDHRARFTRGGQLDLAPLLQESPPGSGRYALQVNGRPWPIRPG